MKIYGPNSLDLTECIKFTFALKRRDITKMNFYCYDPLRARYNCEQIRTDVPSTLFPQRNLQVSGVEPEYLDDRGQDPKRKCEDPGDKYICNTQTEQEAYITHNIITDCFGGLETLDVFPEFSVNHTFYPFAFFNGRELDVEAKCVMKVHFDYNLRQDQVVNVMVRSANLTTYWDVKYHVGPCFS